MYSEKRGPGLWKLNCSFLKDKEYTQLINDTIHSSDLTNQCQNPALKWEFLKYQIRKVSLEYGGRKAKERRKKKL
ncbi:hypothetical protein HOLleu_13674 [Holothuria leucospilota]|uniref:Uncharacterized protein n=1 Tax=Holothuria leucospilota TaxID=206669 RepID=A0A9Q1C7G7_HOLLE|nr:hypothetical protein HOLleu_13674 [Holothuria leucospilota]